jgi:hypothetical protein
MIIGRMITRLAMITVRHDHRLGAETGQM